MGVISIPSWALDPKVWDKGEKNKHIDCNLTGVKGIISLGISYFIGFVYNLYLQKLTLMASV